MCSSQTKDIIDQVVTAKCQAGHIFTAYDATREIQVQEKQQGLPFTRHAEIRDDVLAAISIFVQNGQYTYITIPIANPAPRLFFPVGADPNTYVPFGQTQPIGITMPQAVPQLSAPGGNGATIVAAAIVAAGILQPPPADDDDDFSPPTPTQTTQTIQVIITDKYEDRSPDARGTLTVPAALLANAGFKIGDKVMVVATKKSDKPVLVISRTTLPGETPLTTYTVDPSGNVRLTPFVLKSLFGPTYDFIGDDHEVIVW